MLDHSIVALIDIVQAVLNHVGNLIPEVVQQSVVLKKIGLLNEKKN
jgi:hypothetical protein